MELEELMTNRSLLEKMTDADIHTSNFRLPPKNQVIQQNCAKPKEMCISYKKSNVYAVETTETQCGELEADDGRGCKLPDKLRKLLKILWILVLLCYIFGMPVILYDLYVRLAATKAKITILENNLGVNLNHKQLNTEALKISERENQASGLLNENLQQNYNRPSGAEKRLMALTSEIEKKMEYYMQR